MADVLRRLHRFSESSTPSPCSSFPPSSLLWNSTYCSGKCASLGFNSPSNLGFLGVGGRTPSPYPVTPVGDDQGYQRSLDRRCTASARVMGFDLYEDVMEDYNVKEEVTEEVAEEVLTGPRHEIGAFSTIPSSFVEEGSDYTLPSVPFLASTSHVPPHTPNPCIVGPCNVNPPVHQYMPNIVTPPTGPSHNGAGSENRDAESERTNVYTQAGYGGGPIDTSLLVNFDTHIARSRWDNPSQENKVLRLHMRGTPIDFWAKGNRLDSQQEWVGIAEQSGLMGLQNWTFRETDEALVSAFVERWHPETNSFHFPWGEMTITLHDVHFILGLPLNGVRACTELSHLDDLGLRARIGDMYNLPGDEVKRLLYKGGFNIKKFNQLLDTMRLNGGNPEYIASGYLLELLGSTLFLDKSGDAVMYRLMHLLLDNDLTSEIAWGAATLAYLYRQLGMASRAQAKQLGGCLFILHNWIWRYFPRFRGHLNNNITLMPGEYVRDHGRNRSTESLANIRHTLDLTRMQDVNWMPWRPVLDFSNGEIALSRYRGLLTFLNIKEPYMPDRCYRQFGWHQSIPQREVIRPNHCVRKETLNGNNYEVIFNVEDDHWEQRFLYLEPIGTLARYPYSMDAEYEKWHLRRTHPFLLSTSAEELANHALQAPTELDIYARMAHIQGIVREFSRYKDHGGWGADLLTRLEAVILASTPPPPPPLVPTQRRKRSRSPPPAQPLRQ